jgi:hypothetical protein
MIDGFSRSMPGAFRTDCGRRDRTVGDDARANGPGGIANRRGRQTGLVAYEVRDGVIRRTLFNPLLSLSTRRGRGR